MNFSIIMCYARAANLQFQINVINTEGIRMMINNIKCAKGYKNQIQNLRQFNNCKSKSISNLTIAAE